MEPVDLFKNLVIAFISADSSDFNGGREYRFSEKMVKPR
jgi:hypothetical protein